MIVISSEVELSCLADWSPLLAVCNRPVTMLYVLSHFGSCYTYSLLKVTANSKETSLKLCSGASTFQSLLYALCCCMPFDLSGSLQPLPIAMALTVDVKEIRKVSQKVVPLINGFITPLYNYPCDMGYFLDVISVSLDCCITRLWHPLCL